MSDHELVEWAIREILELDELCRSMIPGYEPLESADMHRIMQLRILAAEMQEVPNG